VPKGRAGPAINEWTLWDVPAMLNGQSVTIYGDNYSLNENYTYTYVGSGAQLSFRCEGGHIIGGIEDPYSPNTRSWPYYAYWH
jgi:hypothetical protein